MTSEKNLQKVFWKIMKKMYKEAEPSLDLDAYMKELKAKNEKSPQNWFMNYYLPEARQQLIIERFTRGLTSMEKYRIRKSVCLGFAPRGVK